MSDCSAAAPRYVRHADPRSGQAAGPVHRRGPRAGRAVRGARLRRFLGGRAPFVERREHRHAGDLPGESARADGAHPRRTRTGLPAIPPSGPRRGSAGVPGSHVARPAQRLFRTGSHPDRHGSLRGARERNRSTGRRIDRHDHADVGGRAADRHRGAVLEREDEGPPATPGSASAISTSRSSSRTRRSMSRASAGPPSA